MKFFSATFDILLTIFFIVLKLSHVIAWSWIWVLSPLWIGAAVVAIIVILALLIALVAIVTALSD